MIYIKGKMGGRLERQGDERHWEGYSLRVVVPGCQVDLREIPDVWLKSLR